MEAIEKAGPGDLTFIANPRYIGQLATTRASAVIVGEQLSQHPQPKGSCALLRARDPYTAFAQAVRLFAQAPPSRAGVDPLAAVAPDVTLGQGVSIAPFAVVETGAAIGARTVIHPHVVVGRGARIGEDCIL